MSTAVATVIEDRCRSGEHAADGGEMDQAGNRGAASSRSGIGSHASHGPSLRDLPLYTRSLLKIRVPLSVTLAANESMAASMYSDFG